MNICQPATFCDLNTQTVKHSSPFHHLLSSVRVSASKADEVTCLSCRLCLLVVMTMPKREVWRENWNFSGHQMTEWSFPTNFLDTGQPAELGPVLRLRLCLSPLWSLNTSKPSSALCQHFFADRLKPTSGLIWPFSYSAEAEPAWLVRGKWSTVNLESSMNWTVVDNQLA